MAHILNIAPCSSKSLIISFSITNTQLITLTRPPGQTANNSWKSLQRNVKSHGRISCLFSDNRSKDQARKALESALGGKKTEFEKWDKEIKKREESGGGGGGGRWRRWFGGSDGDHFWHEAQQASLTILAIAVTCLILAKGDVLLAAVVNPLLFALRSPRNGLSYISSQILKKLSPSNAAKFDNLPKEELNVSSSAKESVVRKWGSD